MDTGSFMQVFRREAGPGGRLSFEQFMRLALFDPAVGYYTAQRARVGKGQGTDFTTATTVGPLFGELVVAAAGKLLRSRGLEPACHHFVEIGAEPDGGVLKGLPHPFASARTLRLGDALTLAGPCIVFSNELLDAQPCRSFLRKDAAWWEQGVEERDGVLAPCALYPVSEDWLPAEAPEGYVFDAPREAAALAGKLAGQAWTGLFIAMDYGRSWHELAEGAPSGTLRAYHQHRQVKNLLERPGEQDLTCHVCWDWIREALGRAGCASTTLQSQEAFFVHHAGDFIGAQLAEAGGGFSPRKQALMQLLHPAHMGQKFQALWAWK
jgi:SAM-dependent MidA family methyltransferase